MAVGSYGIVRPADVSPDDVEILYHYAADRVATTGVTLKKLTSNQVLTPVFHNINTSKDGGTYKAIENVEVLGGLYNLQINASDFTELM